jgi:hypothetical protein
MVKFQSLIVFVTALLGSSNASNLRRQHDHGDHEESGTGDGHSMSHGAFNFTPSGIEWPMCLRHCCNSFFTYFPEPVNNPLCVSADFYANTTECVATNCTAYEQGAYVVVAQIECPTARDDPVDVTEDGVTQLLISSGGDPQDCQGVDNSSIVCANGTEADESTEEENGASRTSLGHYTGTRSVVGGFLMVMIFMFYAPL